MKPKRKTVRTDSDRERRDRPPRQIHEPETTPAQEWGERLDTGKLIARGGKEEGPVPGAEPSEPKE
jgi:hypothetical protein